MQINCKKKEAMCLLPNRQEPYWTFSVFIFWNTALAKFISTPPTLIVLMKGSKDGKTANNRIIAINIKSSQDNGSLQLHIPLLLPK